MNLNQKRTLIATAVIIAGMLLYPPFHRVYSSRVGPGGHHWLFETMLGQHPLPTIDIITLLVQWLGVLIVGGIIFFIFKDNEK